MTLSLITRRSEIRRRLGARFDDELTFPKIFKDSEATTTPLGLERDGAFHVFVNAADSAAFAAARGDAKLVVYGHYFDWDHPTGYRGTSLGEAVRSIAGGETLDIDADVPASRFRALAAVNPLSIVPGGPKRRCFRYLKRRDEIEAQWRATRDADAVGLRPFVSGLRFGPELDAALCETALGFEVLDHLCAENGIDAVLVSSPFNVEMFSGLPESFIRQWGIQAVFVPEAPHITLLSERELLRSDFALQGPTGSVLDFASSLGVSRLGVEEQYVGIGDYAALGAKTSELLDASELLRHWQELRAGSDLGYYITAANAAIAGMDRAMAYMRAEFDAGFTEETLAAVYHEGVERFAEAVGLAGRIKPYFDIIHAGERTMLPAIASPYRIGRAHKTTKFDMGLLVVDAMGCVRGCCDIARSISPDPALQEVHDLLRRLLVDELIPAIRPGMSGEVVHRLGVDVLSPHAEAIRLAGMLPPDMPMSGYTRDCGHTLQRQTLAALHFMPGEERALGAGMLGCTEFVWPFEDKILAAEDGYYLTPRGAIPFTA